MGSRDESVAAKYAGEQGNHHVVIQDAETGLPFRGEFFEVVTTFGVIEHPENPAKTLAECARVLRRGGMMVSQTPTEDALVRRAALWLYRLRSGRFTLPVYQLYVLHGGLDLPISRHSLGTLLERLGFAARRCVNPTYGLRILLDRFHGQPWLAR